MTAALHLPADPIGYATRMQSIACDIAKASRKLLDDGLHGTRRPHWAVILDQRSSAYLYREARLALGMEC